MNESVTDRVGRLISGSLNALIDAVENAAPETVMEEAIRELDCAIDEVKAELGKVVASKHIANKRLMDENKKHEKLAENIEVAIKENREDLASAAISQQLDIEAQIPILESTIVDCSNQEKELEGYINALQAKKRQMREELRQYQDSQEGSVLAATPQGETAGSKNDVASKVDKAESAFDRIFEKATGVLSSSNSGNDQNAAKVVELEKLALDNRIKERLAAIKSTMDKNS